MVDLHKIFHHHFGNSGKGKKKKKKNTVSRDAWLFFAIQEAVYDFGGRKE